jgi:hypothetical protein
MLDDHADAHAGMVDVPRLRTIVDAFAVEGGHVGIEARPNRTGN